MAVRLTDMDQRRVVFSLVELRGEVGAAAVRAAIHAVFFAVFCGEPVRLFRVGASKVRLTIAPAFDARKPNKTLHGITTRRAAFQRRSRWRAVIHELMRSIHKLVRHPERDSWRIQRG